MAEESEWETSSGLPLDGAIADIVAAEFGPQATITPGAVFLTLTFQPYDKETGEAGEQRNQSYSVGNPELWDAADRGARLVRVKSGSYKVSDNSSLGRLMNQAKKCEGALEALRGSPLEADTWVGTRWLWQTFEFENSLSKSGKSKPVLPVEFHGYIDMDEDGSAEDVPAEPEPAPAPAPAAPKASVAPATKAAAPAAPAKAAPAKAAAAPVKKAAAPAAKARPKAAALPDDLRAELWALAQVSDDHDAFAAAAFDIEAVNDSPEAQTAVMNAGPGSIWHDAQAELAVDEPVAS